MTNGYDAAAQQPRSRLSFDLDVDIAIVGAGLAGLTVALEAARLGASIAVLEGRHVGWGASGHHLGTVMPGFGLPAYKLQLGGGVELLRFLSLDVRYSVNLNNNVKEELKQLKWKSGVNVTLGIQFR